MTAPITGRQHQLLAAFTGGPNPLAGRAPAGGPPMTTVADALVAADGAHVTDVTGIVTHIDRHPAVPGNPRTWASALLCDDTGVITVQVFPDVFATLLPFILGMRLTVSGNVARSHGGLPVDPAELHATAGEAIR